MSEKKENIIRNSELIMRLAPRFDEKDTLLLDNVLEYITNKYNAEEDVVLPVLSITKKLTCFQFTVKYLKENIGLSTKDVALKLCRDQPTIILTYKKANEKQPEKIISKKSEHDIPLSAIMSKNSILGSIVRYLKEDKELNYQEIGKLLKRNPRTIWTVYKRK